MELISRRFPLSKKIIIIAAAVLLLGGGAAGYFLFMKKDKPAAHATESKEEKGHEAADEETAKENKEIHEDRKPAPPEEETAAEEEHGSEGGEEKEPLVFKFDPMVVNIFDKNTIHYLKIGLEISCSNAEVVEEIKVKKSQLQDRMMFLTGDTSLREILTSGGKTLLKEDLQEAFNRILKKGKVKKIYFTDFTIQ